MACLASVQTVASSLPQLWIPCLFLSQTDSVFIKRIHNLPDCCEVVRRMPRTVSCNAHARVTPPSPAVVDVGREPPRRPPTKRNGVRLRNNNEHSPGTRPPSLRASSLEWDFVVWLSIQFCARVASIMTLVLNQTRARLTKVVCNPSPCAFVARNQLAWLSLLQGAQVASGQE